MKLKSATIKSFWRLVSVFMIIAVMFTQQALAAITQNDVDCANAGGTGGTCFYDPNAQCSTGQPTVPTSTGPSTTTLPSGTTTDQEIAQTFIVGFDASTPKSVIQDIVSKYHIGGIYLVGTTDAAGAGFNKSFFDGLNQSAGTPLTVASDEEGGLVHRYSYPDISGGFPSAKQMGSMSDTQVQQIGKQVGSDLKANGVTTDLAPVLDVDDGSNIIAKNGRSFSSDPNTIAAKAKAFSQGLESSGVSPVFKHFPGFGGAGSGNTDTTAVTTPSSYNLQQNVIPYQKLLNQGDNTGVMLSNIIITNLTSGKPASISPEAVKYLHDTLNYNGLITTDDLSVLSSYGGGKSVSLPNAVVGAIQAGVDMPLFGIGTSDQTAAESKVQSVIDAVKSGVPIHTVDTAVTQILNFKNNSAGVQPANTSTSCCAGGSQTVPAGTLPSFIPEPYNGAFTQGANNHNVAPALIAALFSEEHNLGNSETDPNTASLPAAWASFVKGQPDPNSGWASSSSGAQGPFQFLPSTFTGLGYNLSQINNLVISADAAAKYAQTDGATKDKPESSWDSFIFSYNHASWYVTAVLKYYDYYNSQPASTPSGGTTVTSETGCTGVQPTDCSQPVSSPGLSQTRQNIVCIAQQELALWKSKPGYPNPAFSQTGYLKYSQNRTEEWCADFATWVYDQAKYPLAPDPSWNIAYVPNIQTAGQNGGKFHWHPQSSGYVPKPGDLAIHGSSHVNIFISSQGGTTTYIGGDQGSGPYPGGSIVSTETGSGYYDNGITGYVSPD